MVPYGYRLTPSAGGVYRITIRATGGTTCVCRTDALTCGCNAGDTNFTTTRDAPAGNDVDMTTQVALAAEESELLPERPRAQRAWPPAVTRLDVRATGVRPRGAGLVRLQERVKWV